MKIFTFRSVLTMAVLIALASPWTSAQAQDNNENVQTNTLYIMGSATSVDFNLNNPIELARSAEDENVFIYSGELTPGEIKLTTKPGSWENPFVRPIVNGSEIGEAPITNEKFQITTGANQEDYKWKVTTPGRYTLSFNMTDNTMSSLYNGEIIPPTKGSINPENVYLLGGASPSGWNIDSPTPMQKVTDYHFVFEGTLTTGELKFCMEKGNWCSPCVRPLTNDEIISLSGVANPDFTVSRYPDNAWKVTEAGDYRIELNFIEFTISVSKYDASAKNPINTETVYMLGDATRVGWTNENLIGLEKSTEDPYIFTYTGNLKPGGLRFCLTQGSWGVPMFRPTSTSSEIGTADFTDEPFDFRTGGEDNNWTVNAYGKYIITLNLKNWTISSKYLGLVWPEVTPIETDQVYMLGDAAPCGWLIAEPTALTPKGDNIFVYDGDLKTGKLEFMTTINDWNAKFIRPLANEEPITLSGVASDKFAYTSATEYPDYMWNVQDEGAYIVTLNLNDWTIKVEKSTTTGSVDGIEIDHNDTITVANICGQVLLNNASPAEMSTLPKGFYIVNGKKVFKNY